MASAKDAFYSSPEDMPSIERAILMKRIKLPVANKGKELTLDWFDPEEVPPYKTEETEVEADIDFEGQTGTATITIPALESSPDSEVPMENTLCAYDNEKEYELQYDLIEDIYAEFYIPILMPAVDVEDGRPIEKYAGAPRSSGVTGSKKHSSAFTTSNYVTLMIPRYIVWQFCGKGRNVIPKGTEFIVATVGGSIALEDMRIIGLFSVPEEE